MARFPRAAFTAVVLSLSVGSHASSSPVCPSVATDTWLSMLAWVSVGQGSWRIDPESGGRTLEQFTNTPGAAFYISDPDDSIIDVIVSGTITVQSIPGLEHDDDNIGIAFGFQGPLPWGDQDNFDMLLFSWGGRSSSTNGFQFPVYLGNAHEYMSIQRFNGKLPYRASATDTKSVLDEGMCFSDRVLQVPADRPTYNSADLTGKPYPDFVDPNHPDPRKAWGWPDGPIGYCGIAFMKPPLDGVSCATRSETVGCFPVAYAEDAGWVRDVVYSFTALFTENELTVAIVGEGDRRILRLTKDELQQFCAGNVTDADAKQRCAKAWQKGRIAWYNLSQNGVKYGNVRQFRLTPDQVQGTDGLPVAQLDVYRVQRGTGSGEPFETLTVPFYEGIMANDYSPNLAPLKIRLGAPPGELVGPAGKTVMTEQDSSVKFNEDGSFEYTPRSGLSAEAGLLDRLNYTVEDDNGRSSEQQSIIFALTPKKAVLEQQAEQWSVTWLENHTLTLDWYNAVQQGTAFGKVQARGSCVLIIDWSFTDGGAEGRFGLQGTADGVNIVAADTERLKVLPMASQLYRLRVRATDVWGTRHSVYIAIRIPAECELRNSCVCTPSGCVCSNGHTGDLCKECDSTRVPASQQPTPGSCDKCASGWLGPECSAFCLNDTTCSGHGGCNTDWQSGRLGECQCEDGYFPKFKSRCPGGAKTCSTPVAACSLRCECGSDHGECREAADPANGGECVCESGWTPKGKSTGGCAQVCTCDERHGSCSADGLCSCDPGWGPSTQTGWSLDTPGPACSCNATADCSGHGDCAWNDLRVVCACETGWLPLGNDSSTNGPKCGQYCSDATCGAHGSCILTGPRAGGCQCEGGWGGPGCTECAAGYYPPPGATTARVAAVLADNGTGNTTNSPIPPAASNATTTPTDSPTVFKALAACSVQCLSSWATAWADAECAVLGSNTGCCSGRGDCVDSSDGGKRCECETGWTGSQCEAEEWLSAPYFDYSSPSYMESPEYKEMLGAAAGSEEGSDCPVFAVGGQCLGVMFVVLLALCFAAALCWFALRRTLGQHTKSKRKGGKIKSYEIDQNMLADIED
eukprot:Hpha_TRINITY_DN1860_c0_g1::TRINITY_DN1860_c0_g1_i1::g.170478::m.170478